ncbi:hypothetical protein NT6N_28140 [Oceaniferula spumae]|uniref:PNPLA domain-containing protein n=1 Tax=Oceaniferula spumae TaxID=2979115 RepID=A0AAT9FPE7_9BACT
MPPHINEQPSTVGSLNEAKVAVALESSFLGFFAHAGFINSLLDSGIRPLKVSGSSSGALVASAYASGLEHEALKEFVLDRKLQRAFREWRILLRGPAVFGAYLGHGIIAGHRAVAHLRRTLPVDRIEKTRNAHLGIGVTNVTRQERQLIHEGDLASFIVASCAAAPIISSQEIDGEYYLDGGFTDGAPFEQWIHDDEIDIIIIHRIICNPPRVKKWSRFTNFISCWSALHNVVTNELNQVRREKAEAAGKKVIVHETATRSPGLIVSKQHSIDNYQTAYDTWKNSPSIT